MEKNLLEVRIKGKNTMVPSACIHGRTIIITGKWTRMATVMDEELVEGDIIESPHQFIESLKQTSIKADIFAFAQRISDPKPNHKYYFEYDNFAVIAVTTYQDWWQNRLSQETRRNVRKAEKEGIVVRSVQLDDQFVQGVKDIYDESPLRQGRKFWHFGKDFNAVKLECSTYPNRSEFIGAYYGQELVGFIKMVYTDDNAHIIHMLSKNVYYDKRPANSLMAKAVEICAQRKVSRLVYRKYVYGRNVASSLTEFKRRNGFQEVRFPRYFIPLTVMGKLALKLRMHRPVKERLPQGVVECLLRIRARYLAATTGASPR
jgi:hypothetical protein